MTKDYRRTKFDKERSDFCLNKKKLEKLILKEHPRVQDFHNQISNSYKKDFIESYDGKCSYCGVSLRIIDISNFEIDHYLPVSFKDKFPTKKDAGKMDNLVLSCSTCNRRKGNFIIPDSHLRKLNPDGQEITKIFIRDDNFYICILPEFSNDLIIKYFFEKLFGKQELHRIDYLLMCMIEFAESNEKNVKLYEKMSKAIELLRQKRHLQSR